MSYCSTYLIHSRVARATLACALLAGAACHEAAAEAASAPERIVLEELRLDGNTLLPMGALSAVLARYRGKRSMEELKEVAASVQALYREAGYGAVLVYIPEQAFTGGSLTLAVLEGRVADVAVVGNQRFNTANVRRAVPALQEGRTPEVRRLDAQVQLANDNPARKLALTLEPGVRPGDVDARVTVSEERTSRYAVNLDNTGSRQTGRLRASVSYQHVALFDLDHQLSLQAQFSPERPGAARVLSATYRAPIYGHGVMLGAYGSYSNVDAGSTPTAAGTLRFNGSGRLLGLSASWLLERAGEFEQRLTATLDRRTYLNNCRIQDLPLGACGSAGESVEVQPVGLDYRAQRAGEHPLAFGLALSHNLGGGGRYAGPARFEAVRPGARRDYTILRANAYGALPVAQGMQLSWRLAGQSSGDGLVPAEQFGLGGVQAVRGYEEREITGDSGWFGSMELAMPAPWLDGLRVAAFADAGMVRNALGTPCNGVDVQCSLGSVGLGLRHDGGGIQWRLDLAQALQAGRTTSKQSPRLHFQAGISLP